MRVSLDWIADFVEIDPKAPGLAGQLAERLTMAGLEVEGLDQPGERLKGFVVGEVLTAEAHPGADRLKLCRVHDGLRERRVVCGAPNVAAGQRIVLARPGVRLPDGQQIKEAKIRGETSEGMICSARELEIGEDHGGILVLEGAPPVGSSAAAALGLDTSVFEIGITPNRADCLSVLGVAREAAAILGRPLRIPELAVAEEGADSAEKLCAVEIRDADKCPRYIARVIRGVKIGPSPAWMQQRLKIAGMRPINNVVDVTNYVMFSLGQPLHAFDMGLLAEGRIVVRTWEPVDGPFSTLDGQERKMDVGDLMICDARRPVAIGGVMGGLNSEVGDGTRNILLESAYFAPATIRRTRRRLGLNSEASYRFERGVDPGGTRRAADWAIELIRQTAGGEVAPGVVDAYPKPVRPARVRLRTRRIAALLGEKVGKREIRKELEALGMKLEAAGKDEYVVEVPTFRPDIEREIDLIEEVARQKGYDQFAATLPPTTRPPAPPSPRRELEEKGREAMVAAGFDEAINYSFVSGAALERLGLGGADVVPLRNPLSAEMDVMRTTLLAGLLGNAALNLNRGLDEVLLFEIGQTFHKGGGGPLPREEARLAAILTETFPPALWPAGAVPGGETLLLPALFDLKGALEYLAEALRLPALSFRTKEDAPPAFEAGGVAGILSEGAEIGTVGLLSRRVCDEAGIRQPVAA
ncbi:MAG: phenylalanine--tRNA ligase subunit beta, partial [bacterium]|nr:phenylalanine--tRNA ligase subunit beta [bacterium]